MLITSTVEICI